MAPMKAPSGDESIEDCGDCLRAGSFRVTARESRCQRRRRRHREVRELCAVLCNGAVHSKSSLLQLRPLPSVRKVLCLTDLLSDCSHVDSLGVVENSCVEHAADQGDLLLEHLRTDTAESRQPCGDIESGHEHVGVPASSTLRAQASEFHMESTVQGTQPFPDSSEDDIADVYKDFRLELMESTEQGMQPLPDSSEDDIADVYEDLREHSGAASSSAAAGHNVMSPANRVQYDRPENLGSSWWQYNSTRWPPWPKPGHHPAVHSEDGQRLFETALRNAARMQGEHFEDQHDSEDDSAHEDA